MKNQTRFESLIGKLGTHLCILLMAFFLMGTMTSCDGASPIDKLNELTGGLFGDTEVLDGDDVDEDDEEDGNNPLAVEKDEPQDNDIDDVDIEEPEAVLVESIGIDAKDLTLPAGQTKQLKANVQPADYEEEITWKSSDVRVATVDEKTGVVKAINEGSANIIAQTSESQKSASVMVTVTPKQNPNYGTVNLGYGTYTGDLKNGKPHGHGTIVYSTSHKIVNSADYYASRGDKFEGDFRDGRISGGMGYWYHNGDITAINP